MTIDEDAAKVVDELIAHADSIGLHSKPIIIAALRRCAEAMREECAKVCEKDAAIIHDKFLSACKDPLLGEYQKGFLNGGRNHLNCVAQAIRRVEVR